MSQYMWVTKEDWHRWQGPRLPGRIAHECPDWDFLPIDEDSEEMASCCCEWEDPELMQLAKDATAKHDAVITARLDALEKSDSRQDDF